MCTIRLIELTVAWQNYKPVSCKMHAFSKIQLVSICYTAVLYGYETICKLYTIYKNSDVHLSDCRVTFFFCFFFGKIQELRNPTTVKPQWLEHLWEYGNLFEKWVVRATDHGARSGSKQHYFC